MNNQSLMVTGKGKLSAFLISQEIEGYMFDL